MLNIQTKASQISNLTDARYFAAMGVNWLEFSLEQGNPNYIAPNSLLAIKEWVEGPKFIGHFGLHNAEEVNEAIKLFSFDAVLLPNFFPLDGLDKLSETIVIQEFVMEKGEKTAFLSSCEERISKVNYLQLNFEKNGFSWSDIKNNAAPLSVQELIDLQKRIPLFLSVDSLQEQHLESIFRTLPDSIICLRGGEEEKVGYKSFDELDELFEKMEMLNQ